MKKLVQFIAALSVVTGCATFKSDLVRMTGEFATCNKADFGQVISSTGLPLLADVANIIENNSTSLENDLSQLATVLTIDAIKCAIASVEAVLAPTQTLARAALPPGLLRAQAWADSHR